MTPWLEDSDVTLYHGDCLSVLAALPAGSVQTCVTSPPYWGLRDYGTGSWTGGDAECDHRSGRANHGHAGDIGERNAEGNAFRNSARYVDQGEAYKDACGKCGARRVDQQIGLEETPTQYVERLVEVFRGVWRVLRADGTLWLNLGDSYAAGKTGRGDAGREGADGFNGGGSVAAFVAQRKPPAGLKPKDLVGIPWRVAFALQQPWYAGSIKREVDRTWLAAMIDAEGCMFIHKRKVGQSNGQGYFRKADSYGAGLEVSSTDRVIVERCMEIAGMGSICEQTPEQNERRKQTIYRWNVRSNVCRDLIRELYPHLVAKQHEARLILGCPSSGSDAERAHESLKAIHQGGTPTIDFPAPASLFSPGWYLRADIIWAKKNCMPESVSDRPTKAHEYVFLLSKQPRYFYDADAIREDFTPGTYRGERRNGFKTDPGDLGNDGGVHCGRNPAGRNVRSVWEIATQPTPEAHFATFPEELVRRCILAGSSEHGECSTCGAPWIRVSEYVETPRNNGSTAANIAANAARGVLDSGSRMRPAAGSVGDGTPKRQLGFAPSCQCDAPARPQTVLDPFVGSGTTALVARKHGRRAIGVELNEEYLHIAAKRTGQQSLLGGA